MGVGTAVIIHTILDNVIAAAREGEEAEFASAICLIVKCMRGGELAVVSVPEASSAVSDAETVNPASEHCVFLGGEFLWAGTERAVGNGLNSFEH